MKKKRATKKVTENGGAGEAGGLMNLSEHTVTTSREQTDGNRTSEHKLSEPAK